MYNEGVYKTKNSQTGFRGPSRHLFFLPMSVVIFLVVSQMGQNCETVFTMCTSAVYLAASEVTLGQSQ